MAKLTYINSRGESIVLGRKTNYFVTSLDGFSNVNNIINSIKSPNQDGHTEINSTLDSRHITIEGEFLQVDRQRGRNKLIQVFNPKLSGYLIYENSTTVKRIACKPESVPTISTSTLATVPFLINLQANNPYWQDMTSIKKEVAKWQGNFEFPLEILVGGIEMGYREQSIIVNVLNNGDVPCGMKIEFIALGTVESPSLFDVNKRKYFKIIKSLEVGEVITVTTNFQNKKVTSSKNGIVENAFNWIDFESTFLQLEVGDNLFRYDAESGLDNLAVNIYYTPQFVGV